MKLACLAISLFVAPLWAANDQSQYLALGDSLAFGFNPLIQPKTGGYIGYPNIVAGVLGLSLSNASCPGETTTTFTTNTIPPLPPTDFFPGFYCIPSQDQVFVPFNSSEVQIHFDVPYDGAQNQLQYAVAFLKTNPSTKLVTINIGLNDIGLLQISCKGDIMCEQNGLPGTLQTIANNLGTIFASLRGTGYKGAVIVIDAFAFNYADPLQTEAISAFNTLTKEVASPFGVTVADIYPVFQYIAAPFGGNTCAAGVLVKFPNGTCDTHPNLIGQAIIAGTVLEAVANQSVSSQQ